MSDHTLQDAINAWHAGDTTCAERVLIAMVEENPDDQIAKLNLASLLFDLRRFDECATLARGVIDAGNLEPAAFVMLSRVATVTGHHDLALEHMAGALRLAPESREITVEFVNLARHRYWTYRPDSFEVMHEAAQAGELLVDDLPRLAHQSFAKIVRPRLIELLVAEEPSAEAAIGRWQKELDEAASEALGVLAANLMASVTNLLRIEDFGPRRAGVTLRNGSHETIEEFTDIDPFTAGQFELVLVGGDVLWLPFDRVASIRFGPAGESPRANVRLRDGSDLEALMPMFYMFTEFCSDHQVLSGKRFLSPQLTENLRIPLGMRMFSTGDGIIPGINVASVDFLT